MTMFFKIGQDDADTTYFAVKYELGCLSGMPWGDEKFDCLIFKHDNDDLMRQAIDELLTKNCDWVHTAGKDSEYWHDYIDQRSVDLGRQADVGDGNPMTAWHEEMTNPEKWESTINFGGSDYFLIVLVGFTEIKRVLETLKGKFAEDLTSGSRRA
jgi:hypothetical protein